MVNNGFSIFVLSRPKDGPFRVLRWSDGSIDLNLTESGFLKT